MRATLGKLVTSGVTVLICPRCGWYAHCAEGYKLDIDARACPVCKGWLDAVEPKG